MLLFKVGGLCILCLWRCEIADGVTHREYLNKGWFFIFPLGLLICIFSNSSYWYIYLLFTYYNYYWCRYIDPDSDLSVFTHSEAGAVSDLKKINIFLGLFGAFFAGYSFVYSYIAGIFGGHRKPFSHGWVIGTIGRMIFFNIPLFLALTYFNNYAVTNWGIENGWTKSIWFNLYMGVWFFPYIVTQFISWNVGDGIHLILDTEWAKGVLYKPKKQK